MIGRQSVVVKPLHEELEEMGLDAEKVKRDILENSRGMPMATVNPQALTEDNSVATAPTDDVDAFDDDDFDVEESEETDDEFPEIDEDFEEDDEEIEEDEDEDGEELDEAFKVQKMRRLTSGEKAKAKKARKKSKGKRKAYAKKYYARAKKKIAKRRKKLLKKYGKKGLEKLHKQRKRLVAGIDRLATLREELEGAGAPGTTVTPVEEAAINAGWLALLLGEIFESLGDADVAEMLESISDVAASLSEELEGVPEDELSEDQQGSLRQIFEAVAKALEAHEDLGSPSLMEAIDYGLENGLMEDEDEEDGELDEDEELEDESPFDELDEESSGWFAHHTAKRLSNALVRMMKNKPAKVNKETTPLGKGVIMTWPARRGTYSLTIPAMPARATGKIFSLVFLGPNAEKAHQVGKKLKALIPTEEQFKKMAGETPTPTAQDMKGVIGPGWKKLAAPFVRVLDGALSELLNESQELGEAEDGVFVPKKLGPIMHHWHAGMGDPVYKVGSLAFAGKMVPRDLVVEALENLEAEKDDASGSDKKELVMLCNALKKALK